MNKFYYLPKIKFLVYIIFYLISIELAISQTSTNKIISNLENAFNDRDYTLIKKIFEEKESSKITSRLKQIIDDFPNSKWTIKEKESATSDKKSALVNISGSKLINGREYVLDSNFNYHYLLKNGKIQNGSIKNHLTTIRNDNNLLDINFSIPNSVLTGSNYDIDIIVNNQLEENILAGGIKSHQIDSIFEQSIPLEPLVSGGIFKVTRAPIQPGIQVWTGIIAYPKGLISFTKSVNIIDEL
tara:strand:- start:201 stop:926 length:726 start_codon:yes stop_codon:yes gene_type:complete